MTNLESPTVDRLIEVLWQHDRDEHQFVHNFPHMAMRPPCYDMLISWRKDYLVELRGVAPDRSSGPGPVSDLCRCGPLLISSCSSEKNRSSSGRFRSQSTKRNAK